jgi:PAS domain S-box-containing protein
VGDGVFLVERETRAIRLWNPAAEAITGLREQDVLGASVDEAIPGWADVRNLVPTTDSPGDAAATRAQTVPIDVHGRELWLSIAGVELDDGVVYAFRDLTQERMLERMKSDFVAAASHELRSPLTSIKGFAELMGRSDDLTDRQREATDIIRASTDRLVGLVDDLLEVARIEAGRLSVEPRPVAIGPLVEETAGLLAPRLEAKRQRLELDLAPDLPLAFADARRVRQILDNLFANAHLYTGEGGRIAVRGRGRDDTVEIAVADTGRGMTAEEIEHAFDRFFRGERAGMLVPGTGLGLWIVRSLVELQHGEVKVESELGRGSAFTVRLPRAPAGARRPADDGDRARDPARSSA